MKEACVNGVNAGGCRPQGTIATRPLAALMIYLPRNAPMVSTASAQTAACMLLLYVATTKSVFASPIITPVRPCSRVLQPTRHSKYGQAQQGAEAAFIKGSAPIPRTEAA